MLKKWVATSDGRTRPAHAAASGQIVDMNEDFTVGGMPMGYAGDPAPPCGTVRTVWNRAEQCDHFGRACIYAFAIC